MFGLNACDGVAGFNYRGGLKAFAETMTRQAIYLDHNASSPLLPEARAAQIAALDLCGNPSSVHGHGRALRNLIETGRDQVAKLAGADRQQVVFDLLVEPAQ